MTKEKIYDTEINPLMAKIIDLCKRHKISLVADFGLDEDLHCTSAVLTDDCNPTRSQLAAFKHLRPTAPIALAETIETKPDGSKHITIRRIS